MIKTDIDEEIIYKVSRMLDYEMENLQIDTYAKAELLVIFKYVLENIDHFRAVFGEDIEEEYEMVARTLLKRK